MSVYDQRARAPGARCRRLAARLAAAALVLAPIVPLAAASPAGQDQPCRSWHGEAKDEPFEPKVMEIELTGDVGPDMAIKLFSILQDHLTSYPTIKTVKVLLSSTGGYSESGFKIYNYLRGLHELRGFQVVTHNNGSVQSAAVDIYCGGNQRLVSPYSFFMVHEAAEQLARLDPAETARDADEEISVTSAASHRLFSHCTNLPVAEVDALFDQQTYIDQDQALAMGLAHSVVSATYDRAADLRCRIEGHQPELETSAKGG